MKMAKVSKITFVNYKLTFVLNGFSFLFGNVLLDYPIRNGSGADSQVPPGSNVSAPQLFPDMREFLKEHPRTCPFQPLDHFTYLLLGMTGNENVNMVA
jgi:hypothetical protein